MTRRRIVVVAPLSGLGNRMRVVCGAWAWAETARVPVQIAWQATRDCRARFDELFEPLPPPWATVNDGGALYTPATKRNLLLPGLLRLSLGFRERRCFRPADDGHFARLAASARRLYVDSCHCLHPYPAGLMQRLFTPLPHLQQRILRFKGPSLGVHIRRTDNAQAILHSPTQAFRQAIDRYIEQGQAHTIYLATDDQQVKTLLRAAYGQRLVCQSAPAQRATLRGMEDAVVDLWTLAHCTRILGSHYSSFSETAAEILGHPLHVIRQ